MATRFYLPSSGAAAVNPPFTFSSAWAETTGADRIRCVTTKIGSTMTSKTQSKQNTGDTKSLMRQYVSDPLAAQTIPAGTWSGVLRCLESASNDNLDMVPMKIIVVTNDGQTLRGTLAAGPSRYYTNAEYSSSTLTSCIMASAVAYSQLVVSAGDRIVIEIGFENSSSGTSIEGTQSFGDDSSTDLALGTTETTANNPWVEFSQTITIPVVTTKALTATAVGSTVTLIKKIKRIISSTAIVSVATLSRHIHAFRTLVTTAVGSTVSMIKKIRKILATALSEVAATEYTSYGGTTTCSFSHTVTSGTNVLLVNVAYYQGGQAITSATWNDISLTYLQDSGEAYLGMRAYTFYLANPTPATGNVVAVSSGFSSVGAGAINVKGVDYSDFYRDWNTSNGSSGSVSVGVASVSGDTVVDIAIQRSSTSSPTFTPDTPQIQLWMRNLGTNIGTGQSYDVATSTSTFMDWTISGTPGPWAAAAVSLKPSVSVVAAVLSSHKIIFRILTATITSVVDLITASIKKYYQTLTATAVSVVATLSRLATLFRTLTATAVGSTVSFIRKIKKIITTTTTASVVEQSSSSTSDNTIIFSHAVTSGTDVLMVCISHTNSTTTVTSAQWNTIGLTALTDSGSSGSATSMRTWIYYLVNPTPATANIVVTVSSTQFLFAGAINIKGVNYSDFYRAYATNRATSGSPTVNVTSTNGDTVVDMASLSAVDPTIIPDSSQTTVWIREISTASSGQSYEIATGVSTTMSWIPDGTPVAWSIAAVSLKPYMLPTVAILSALKRRFQTLSASISSTATAVLRGMFKRALTVSAIVSIVTLSMWKTMYRILNATVTSAVSMIKKIFITLSASIGSIADLIAVSAGEYYQELTATATVTVATINRHLTLFRILITDVINSSVIITRSILYRILATATVTSAVSMIKKVGKLVITTAISTVATISRLLTLFRTLTATAVGSTVSMIKKVRKILTATAIVSVATLSRHIHAFRTLVTTAVGSTVSMIKKMYKLLSIGGGDIAFGNASNAAVDGTILPIAHTVAADTQVLIVGATFEDAAVLSYIRYNNGLNQPILINIEDVNDLRTVVGYIPNPPVGPCTIQVAIVGGAKYMIGGVVDIKGVDAADFYRTVNSDTNSSGDPTLVLSSVVGDVIIDTAGQLGDASAFTAGTSQTELVVRAGVWDTLSLGMSYKAAVSTSTTMTWHMTGGTGGIWTMGGICLKPNTTVGLGVTSIATLGKIQKYVKALIVDAIVSVVALSKKITLFRTLATTVVTSVATLSRLLTLFKTLAIDVVISVASMNFGAAISKTLSVTVTSTVSMIKQIRKIISAIITTTVVLSRLLSLHNIMVATATSSIVSVLKKSFKTLSASITSIATLSYRAVVLVLLTVTVGSTVSIIKKIRKIITSTAIVSVATLSRHIHAFRTLVTTAVGSTVSMIGKAKKLLTATAIVSVVTMSKLLTISKFLTTVEVGSVAIFIKKIKKSLIATAIVSAATLSRILTLSMILTSTVVGSIVTLTRLLSLHQTITTIAVDTISILTKHTHRVLSATITSIISITRKNKRLLLSSITSVVSLKKILYRIIFASTSTIGELFKKIKKSLITTIVESIAIVVISGVKFYQTLSATVTSTASMIKKVGKLVITTAISTVATISRLLTLFRTLTATAVGSTVSMIKKVRKILTATAIVSVATLSRLLTLFRTLTATAVGSTASRIRKIKKIMSNSIFTEYTQYQFYELPSASWSHTVTPSTPILLVHVIYQRNSAILSATWNGITLTQLIDSGYIYNGLRAYTYYLVNPTPATGNVVITFDGWAYGNTSAINLKGVNSSDWYRATAFANGNGITVSVDVTSMSGDIVLDLAGHMSTSIFTAGSGQLLIWKNTVPSLTHYEGQSYKIATSTTTTMSWNVSGTSNKWAASAISLKPPVSTTIGIFSVRQHLHYILSVIVNSTPTFIRKIRKIVSATITSIADLIAASAGKYYHTLTATAISTVAMLSMWKTMYRILTSTAIVSVATLSRHIHAFRTLVTTAVGSTVSMIKKIRKILTATAIVSVAMLSMWKTMYRTLTSTAVGSTVTLIKKIKRIISSTAIVSVATIVRKTRKIIIVTAIVSVVTLARKLALHRTLITTAVSSVASMVKLIHKIMTIIAESTTTLLTGAGIYITLAADAVISVVSMTRWLSLYRILAATASSTVSIIKHINKIIAAIITSMVSILKKTSIILSASIVSVAILSRLIMKLLVAMVISVIDLITNITRRYFMTLAADAVNTIATVFKNTFKILSASIASVAVLDKLIKKVLLAISTTIITIRRFIYKIMQATILCYADLMVKAAHLIYKILSAIPTSMATISRYLTLFRILAATTTSMIILIKNIPKILSSTSTAVVSIIKLIHKTITTIIGSTVTIIKHIAYNLLATAFAVVTTIRSIHKIMPVVVVISTVYLMWAWKYFITLLAVSTVVVILKGLIRKLLVAVIKSKTTVIRKIQRLLGLIKRFTWSLFTTDAQRQYSNISNRNIERVSIMDTQGRIKLGTASKINNISLITRGIFSIPLKLVK